MKFYRHICIYFLTIVVLTLSAYSYNNTRTRIYLETKNGYKIDKLVFGINKLASSSLDTALSEFEAPPFAPPQGQGINAGFVIYDTTQESNIWTYLDLRPFPKSDTSWVYYKIQALIGAGDIITVKWAGIGAEIDSAILTDVVTNGMLINVDMKKSSSVVMPNEFVDEFYLKVKYPNDVEDVSDENTNIAIPVIYPNPAENEINISSGDIIESLTIVNTNGSSRQISDIYSSDYCLDIRDLPCGSYILIINTKNFSSYTNQFIKLK